MTRSIARRSSTVNYRANFDELGFRPSVSGVQHHQVSYSWLLSHPPVRDAQLSKDLEFGCIPAACCPWIIPAYPCVLAYLTFSFTNHHIPRIDT